MQALYMKRKICMHLSHTFPAFFICSAGEGGCGVQLHSVELNVVAWENFSITPRLGKVSKNFINTTSL